MPSTSNFEENDVNPAQMRQLEPDHENQVAGSTSSGSQSSIESFMIDGNSQRYYQTSPNKSYSINIQDPQQAYKVSLTLQEMLEHMTLDIRYEEMLWHITIGIEYQSQKQLQPDRMNLLEQDEQIEYQLQPNRMNLLEQDEQIEQGLYQDFCRQHKDQLETLQMSQEQRHTLFRQQIIDHTFLFDPKPNFFRFSPHNLRNYN